MAIKHKIKIKDKSVFKDKDVSDEEYAEHCKKFFKGESGDTSGPAQTVTQKQTKEKA